MRPVPLAVLIALALAGPVLAKLPALSDEAKAKAAEAAAKSAWSDKVGGYKLCQAMDRVADVYRKEAKAAGREASAPGKMYFDMKRPQVKSSAFQLRRRPAI